MSIVDPDIEIPALPSPIRSNFSVDDSLSSRVPFAPPGSSTSAADVVTNSFDHSNRIHRPIPAYLPPHPITVPLSINESPSVHTYPPPETGGSVDSDVLQYAMTHDHAGETPVTRVPEADLLSLRSSQGAPESLPPYGADAPPKYTRRIENMPDEPKTLARFFFKYGFFFPAFWVFGALMLITPLRSPNPFAQNSAWPPDTTILSWCNEHIQTEEDKAEFLMFMQEVEMRWARRCLLALGMLACFCIAIGVTIFAIVKINPS